MTKAWRSVFLFGLLYTLWQISTVFAVDALVRHAMGWTT